MLEVVLPGMQGRGYHNPVLEPVVHTTSQCHDIQHSSLDCGYERCSDIRMLSYVGLIRGYIDLLGISVFVSFSDV